LESYQHQRLRPIINNIINLLMDKSLANFSVKRFLHVENIKREFQDTKNFFATILIN